MNEQQKRILVMCEIHFYEAQMDPVLFKSFLQRQKWSGQSDFVKAELSQLRVFAMLLRSYLRSHV